MVSSRQPDKKKTNPFLGLWLLDHSNGTKNRKVFHVKAFFPSVPVWECSYSTWISLCWRFWLIFSWSYHSMAGRVNLISSLKNGSAKDFWDKESVLLDIHMSFNDWCIVLEMEDSSSVPNSFPFHPLFSRLKPYSGHSTNVELTIQEVGSSLSAVQFIVCYQQPTTMWTNVSLIFTL